MDSLTPERREAQARVQKIAGEIRAAHAVRQSDLRTASPLAALAPQDSYGAVGIVSLATMAAKGVAKGLKFLKSEQGQGYISKITKSASDYNLKYKTALSKAKTSRGGSRKRWLRRAARYKDKLDQAKWSEKLATHGIIGEGPVLEYRRNLLALEWDGADDKRKKEIEKKVASWDSTLIRIKREQDLLTRTIQGGEISGVLDGFLSWKKVEERARQVAPTGRLKPGSEDILQISRATGAQGLGAYSAVNGVNQAMTWIGLSTLAPPVTWMVIGGVAGATLAFHLARLAFERNADKAQIVELAKQFDLPDVVEDPGFMLTLVKMTPEERLDMGAKLERLVDTVKREQRRDKLARRLRMVGAVAVFEAARNHETAEVTKDFALRMTTPEPTRALVGADREKSVLTLDQANTKIGRLLSGGVGGQRFVTQAPPGPGRLVRVPFYPETDTQSWSGGSGIDRPGDDPILRVQILPDAFATDGSYRVVTRALSYGRYRIVGLQTNFQGSYNSVLEGTQGPDPVAVSLSDLQIYNGQNMFIQEGQVPAGTFSVLPTNIVLNSPAGTADELFENPTSYRRRSSRFFAGLRANPVVDTDSTVSMQVWAFTSATMADNPGQVDMPFSAWLVGEMLEDKVFGNVINPGPYARAGAQVKVGAKDLGYRALENKQQFVVTSARYRQE